MTLFRGAKGDNSHQGLPAVSSPGDEDGHLPPKMAIQSVGHLGNFGSLVGHLGRHFALDRCITALYGIAVAPIGRHAASASTRSNKARIFRVTGFAT
jgi:hypothetical protein